MSDVNEDENQIKRSLLCSDIRKESQWLNTANQSEIGSNEFYLGLKLPPL